jgi:hypothetical protein
MYGQSDVSKSGSSYISALQNEKGLQKLVFLLIEWVCLKFGEYRKATVREDIGIRESADEVAWGVLEVVPNDPEFSDARLKFYADLIVIPPDRFDNITLL